MRGGGVGRRRVGGGGHSHHTPWRRVVGSLALQKKKGERSQETGNGGGGTPSGSGPGTVSQAGRRPPTAPRAGKVGRRSQEEGGYERFSRGPTCSKQSVNMYSRTRNPPSPNMS